MLPRILAKWGVVLCKNPCSHGMSIFDSCRPCRPVNPSEGWDTGSPQLKINTQKLHKWRQMSDGPPAAFYSPAAVINEPTFDGRSMQKCFAGAPASTDLVPFNRLLMYSMWRLVTFAPASSASISKGFLALGEFKICNVK